VKSWMALFVIGFGTMWLVCIGPCRRCAEIIYNQDSYKQLADADSSKGVPLGTKITVQNWEQYETFTSVQMQAGFSKLVV